MKDQSRTKQTLIEELTLLRRRIAELEKRESDRRPSEQAMREEEEKCRILFGAIHDAVFVHALDEKGLPGRFLEVNDAACRRLGYAREELLSLTPRDITTPEEYERIAGKRTELASRGTVIVETIHRTKDGSQIPVESHIRRFQYFGTQAALSISRDLTQHRWMQEALQQSEGRLNAMLQSIPDHMSVMDRDLNIVWANESARRIFGGDLIGRKCYEAYHGRTEPCEPHPCLVLKAFQDGCVHEHQTGVLDKDGRTLLFHCTANAAIRDQNGMPTAVLEISRNITETKQLEQELRAGSERYRELSTLLESLFDAIPDILGIQDTVHGMIRYNRAGYDFLGRTQGEVQGKKCFELINRTKPCEVCATSEVYRTRKPARVEKYIEERGVWLDCRSYPVFDGRGNLTKIIEHLRDITELKQAENRLQEREEMLHLIMGNMSDMIRVTDLKGVNLFASPSHFKGLGYRPEEREGRPVFDIVHPDDLEKVIRAFSEGLAARRRTTVEYRVRHADGHYVWLETVGDALLDDRGDITAVVMSSRDVSKRMQAEEALRESESLQRTMLENLPAGVMIVDAATRVIESVNAAAAALFGVQAERIVGNRCHSFICPSHKEACPVLDLGKEVDNAEREMVCADGGRRPVLKSVKRIQMGGREKLLECFVDITPQKQSEEALRESEEKYRMLFDSAAEGICVVQGEIIRLANPALVGILGYPLDIITSKPFAEFIHPEDRAMVLDRQRRRMKGDTVETGYFFRIVSGDRTIKWLQIFPRVILWDGLPSVMSFIMDVTEKKKVEDEKTNLEDRLRRSEKMEALGQLAGGVAHDLNNILGVISGYSELLLLETPEGHRSRWHADKILRFTEQAATVIQDLLTLARRGVAASEVVNLNSVVSDFMKSPVFENLRDYHPRVDFRAEYDSNLLNIIGSPVHLEKTLMNLVSNAAESISGSGEVTIRTEGRYLDKPLKGYDEIREGDYAVLAVSDTGMGIPAVDRRRVFEPFYTRKVMGRSGSGLGLAIVWGVVKDHNGYIDVQSEVGAGTTFALYFPVTREQRSVPRRKEPMESYMGRGESVLVVDDIAEQRDVAAGLLTRLGYDVRVVSGGEEAVEYLRRNKADIVVLDMIMAPGMDGLETYRSILAIQPRQKAIIVSGFSETERVRQAQMLGAGAYVKKPYVMEKIGLAVREELDRK